MLLSLSYSVTIDFRVFLANSLHSYHFSASSRVLTSTEAHSPVLGNMCCTLYIIFGASSRVRTGTYYLRAVFETAVSTNFTIEALFVVIKIHTFFLHCFFFPMLSRITAHMTGAYSWSMCTNSCSSRSNFT